MPENVKQQITSQAQMDITLIWWSQQVFDENTLFVMTLGTEILMETIYTGSTKVDAGGGKKALFGPFVRSAWDVSLKKTQAYLDLAALAQCLSLHQAMTLGRVLCCQ